MNNRPAMMKLISAEFSKKYTLWKKILFKILVLIIVFGLVVNTKKKDFNANLYSYRHGSLTMFIIPIMNSSCMNSTTWTTLSIEVLKIMQTMKSTAVKKGRDTFKNVWKELHLRLRS
jgi:cell division protein FtsW (lipid II flippase)